MRRRQVVMRAIGLGAAAGAWMAAGRAEEPWPERVVTLEQMRYASAPPTLRLSRSTTRGAKTLTTVVIVAHVDREGRVVRSRIEQPSTSHHLDETVLRTTRDLRFEPYRVDGVAEPVTLVLPFHVAAEDIPRWKF